MSILLYIIILTLLSSSCSDGANDQIEVQNNEETDVSESLESDSLEKSYYSSGELKQIIEYNDEGSGFEYTMYHKNGNRQLTGEQGRISGCGIPVGDELHFDTSGTLIQKITYDHFIEEHESCHQIGTVKSFTNYYQNGSIKKSGKIETCYECEECPCGKWLFYDEDGNLERTENYGDCYDSQLDCGEKVVN